jgi:repressor LexA
MPAFLTRRQKEILEFIAGFQSRHGIAPTHREICERFGYSSYGTAHKHLKLLERKGYLVRRGHQKRGVELQDAAAAVVGGARAQELPFYGRIAAGRPIEALPAGERVGVPEHLLRGRASEHYVLRVAGDSMVDEGIHDGDLVVVRRRDRAEVGEMVVALVGEEATLKRYYPEGDQVRLQPAAPGMRPLLVPAATVRVQGVVVGLMRRYE